MILDTFADVTGPGAFAPAVQVFVLTVGTGVAVKAGALAFWRNTEQLFAPLTYLKLGTILALAAGATVLAARRGIVDGGITRLTVYALVLAKLVDQSYALVFGG